MDIPLVLGGDDIIPGIEENKYKFMKWGPNSNTRNTYEELVSTWPQNAEFPPPTKQAMQNYYNQNWGS